jgi:hypothetical protein
MFGYRPDLGVALLQNGRIPESFEALPSCLQVDPSRLLLRERATEAGEAETASAAARSAELLAPAGERVGALSVAGSFGEQLRALVTGLARE